jgi:MoxR-like ATPase
LKLEDLKSLIFGKDDYIGIAIREYMKFKGTKYWGEGYKWETFSGMNAEVGQKRINAENIVDHIKYYQKHNPPSGSFVHWSSISDLLAFAEDEPVTVAELFNNLYEEDLDVDNRIRNFYDKGKAYNPSLKLGTPLFGYLLAGYDAEKYPLYKDEIFRDFLKTFTISESMGDIASKYTAYYSICKQLIDYFQSEGYMENPTMLDAQDFIYCISQYESLYTKIGVIYLSNHSKRLEHYSNSTLDFLDYIVTLDSEYLSKISNKYRDNQKINMIRYRICEKILGDGSITTDELKNIQSQVSNMYDTDILKAWNDFRVLFPFYYEQYKEKINIEIRKLYDSIKRIEELKGERFKADKYICDFLGPHNFGSTFCWFAIYPEEKKDHKEAAQLFFYIDSNKVNYGLEFGSNIKPERSDNAYDRLETVSPEDFVFDRMKQKYIEVFNLYKSINETDNATAEDSGEKEDEDDIQGLASVEIPTVSFDREIELNSLYFQNKDIILNQIATALETGKHIILIGPPGTGKSKLAKEICNSYEVEYKMSTATSDWSTYNTIGGYKPSNDGTLYFDEGIFLSSIRDKQSKEPINRWLIIDELNRADIDKAFGELFSALAGDQVVLSFKVKNQGIIIKPQSKEEEQIEPSDHVYIIPRDWRIIGTMNTYDKASLYEMSYAFMRRFAFIPVPVPQHIDENLVKKYLKLWGIEDRSINDIDLVQGLVRVWRIVNKYRAVGPALIEDVARYVCQQGDYLSAIILYILPQFEGISGDLIGKFVEELSRSGIKGLQDNKELMLRYIEDFFDIRVDKVD